MKIIIQEYNVEVTGPGCFTVKTENDEGCFIPTFGFNYKGEVKSRRKGIKEGYATLKRRWINKQISEAIGHHLKEYGQDIVTGQNYEKDTFDYEIEENGKECEAIYVFVFSRSDCPDEIGIATSDTPFIVEDSSVSFTESEII